VRCASRGTDGFGCRGWPDRQGAAPTRDVLEVGSAAGLRDLIPGNDVGPQTSFAASGVPAGRYYVRVRAMPRAWGLRRAK